MESNDSPEIPDRGKTSDIPGLPSGDKTMEIQTYIHAFINRKLHNYYILFLSHLPSCVLKLMSVLHGVICIGIEFQRDAPAKEKLVLNRSILGLGSIIDRDGARLLRQIKRCLRDWGARFRNDLKTSSALFNISFSRSGSSPKRCSISSVVTDKSDIINFAALLWREFSMWNRISLQPSQTVDA